MQDSAWPVMIAHRNNDLLRAGACMHVLVYDLSNIGYLSISSLPSNFESRPDGAEKLYVSIRQFAKQLYLQLKPEHTIFACDSLPYWRSELFPEYKANRKDSVLRDCVRDAVKLFQDRHKEWCVSVNNCEADDVMFVLSQRELPQLTIISTDGDLHQLRQEQVAIFNPTRREFVNTSLAQKNFALFEKCIRGDRGDNIPSAYPYVTKKRLQRAFKDHRSMEQLLDTRIADGSVVRDNYEFNRRLIDLSHVPIELQNAVHGQLDEILARCA